MVVRTRLGRRIPAATTGHRNTLTRAQQNSILVTYGLQVTDIVDGMKDFTDALIDATGGVKDLTNALIDDYRSALEADSRFDDPRLW